MKKAPFDFCTVKCVIKDGLIKESWWPIEKGKRNNCCCLCLKLGTHALEGMVPDLYCAECAMAWEEVCR